MRRTFIRHGITHPVRVNTGGVAGVIFKVNNDPVTDSGTERVDIALELGVRKAADAVLQIREVLGERASDAEAVERFAVDRIDAAIEAAAVPGISFDELSAEAEASIKSSLPAFTIDSLRITRVSS